MLVESSIKISPCYRGTGDRSIDRPSHPWALGRLGIHFFHEAFGERNRIEWWFRTLEERTRRFYDNVDAKSIRSIEELASITARAHNLRISQASREVIHGCH